MKIYDIANPFLSSYEPTENYYENYFSENLDIYSYYFEHHCLNKEMKLEKALVHHPGMIQEMKWIARKIASLTPEVTIKYEDLYPIKFTKDVYIFVGLGVQMPIHIARWTLKLLFALKNWKLMKMHLK